MKKTRIILAMPSHSNFAQPILENLKFHGFEVEFINSSPEHIKRIAVPIYGYLIHYMRKLFFRDASFKKKLKNSLKNHAVLKSIQSQLQQKQFDYSLVIRPDFFTADQLQFIKNHTLGHFIGYQWNGLGRFPATLPLIKLFDRFFAFDNEDFANPDFFKYDILGTTNFYFDMYQPQPIAHQGTVAYFVGLHFNDRSKNIDQCAQALLQQGITLDFNIKFRNSNQNQADHYQTKEIKSLKKNIVFEENIHRINCADLLVDVVNPVHKGLSFRTFEALYYQKKLITNNSAVREYDFYHPNNIFIWDNNDLSGLAEFLAKPWVQIDPIIIQKYSFYNWIKYILDMPPYNPVMLPTAVIENKPFSL